MTTWTKEPPKEPGIALDRLCSRVESVTDRGCWLWGGATHPSGHGKMTIDGQAWYAHRLMYASTRGGIPIGALVTHRCDVPNCINPTHLAKGDYVSNAREMSQRGRSLVGEKHPLCKITDKDAIEIRSMLASGRTQRDVARTLGVSQSQVNAASRRPIPITPPSEEKP